MRRWPGGASPAEAEAGDLWPSLEEDEQQLLDENNLAE
jgi:hypothetical protein